MKKLLLLLFVATFSVVVAFPQTPLPTKLTKGIEIETDDFEGGIKYMSKTTGLTVLSKPNECLFMWELICADAVPFSFNKVQILVNGVVEDIPFIASQYKEFSEVARVPVGTFSGSRMAVTYVNQDRYLAKISIDASQYISLLENIIAEKKDTKIRFCGNKNIDGLFDKKEKKEIETIILIYRILTAESFINGSTN